MIESELLSTRIFLVMFTLKIDSVLKTNPWNYKIKDLTWNYIIKELLTRTWQPY